ncbi:MAG: hypothetical protein GY870_11580, partial [archaeon]|nr:hypothetical protein [archaeon]
MEAKFPFIREDIFLIARVDAETGRQQLIIRYINLTTGKTIKEEAFDCVHVVLSEIPSGKFVDTVSEENFE